MTHCSGETIQRQSPTWWRRLGVLTGTLSKRTAGKVALNLSFGSTGKTDPCRSEVGPRNKQVRSSGGRSHESLSRLYFPHLHTMVRIGMVWKVLSDSNDINP